MLCRGMRQRTSNMWGESTWYRHLYLLAVQELLTLRQCPPTGACPGAQKTNTRHTCAQCWREYFGNRAAADQKKGPSMLS